MVDYNNELLRDASELLRDADESEFVHDLSNDILYSLKLHKIDYCFTERDLNKLKILLDKEKISACYRRKVDRFGKLDYYEIIPAVFYMRKDSREEISNPLFTDINNIPKNLKCYIYLHKRMKLVKDYNSKLNISSLVSENNEINRRVNNTLTEAKILRKMSIT